MGSSREDSFRLIYYWYAPEARRSMVSIAKVSVPLLTLLVVDIAGVAAGPSACGSEIWRSMVECVAVAIRGWHLHLAGRRMMGENCWAVEERGKRDSSTE